MLVVAGLVAAPGYYVYTTFATGATAGRFALRAQAAGGGYGPLLITLTPEMNPVVLVVHAQAQWRGHEYGPLRNRYSAVLYTGELPVAERRFELTAMAVESHFQTYRVPLSSFEVPIAGEYRLLVAEAAPRDLQVDKLELEIRRNVRNPDPRVVWTGVGLLVAGFALLLL
jgi:hypothetical protein